MLVRDGGVSGGVSGRVSEVDWIGRLNREDLVLDFERVEDTGGSDGGR